MPQSKFRETDSGILTKKLVITTDLTILSAVDATVFSVS